MKPYQSKFNIVLSAVMVLSTVGLPLAHAQSGESLLDLMPPSSSAPAPRSMNGSITLFDTKLTHPMPVWSRFADGAAPVELSKFQRSRQENIFRIDMAPKDEDFKNWRNLFSIIAFKNHRGTLEDQARQAVGHFRSVCSPANMTVFPINRSSSRLVMAIACGAYSRQRDIGQMAALVFMRQGNTAVTLMRQWKSKSFLAKLEEQWPVEKPEMNSVLQELVRSRLIPKKG